MPTARSYPKAVRIRRRRDYQRVQRGGHRRHTRHFVVVSMAGHQRGHRLGVTVSSRVGSSVERNRVKRHVREIFRTMHSNVPGASDMVVIAKRGAPGLTHAEIAGEIEQVLRSVGAG